MSFHEIVTTYVVPAICGIIIWMTRQQNKKIEEVHVLVNQKMTDALAQVVLSMLQVAGLTKALAEQSPENKALAERAALAISQAKEAIVQAPPAVVEKVKEMPTPVSIDEVLGKKTDER